VYKPSARAKAETLESYPDFLTQAELVMNLATMNKAEPDSVARMDAKSIGHVVEGLNEEAI
jgi:hypothetical protein